MRCLSVKSYRHFGRAGFLHMEGLHSTRSKQSKTTQLPKRWYLCTSPHRVVSHQTALRLTGALDGILKQKLASIEHEYQSICHVFRYVIMDGIF
jgi:hypothetical protein